MKIKKIVNAIKSLATKTTSLETKEETLSNQFDKLNITQMEGGNVDITPSAANTPTGKAVTFSNKFSGTPVIMTTVSTGYIGTVVLGSSVTGRSSTGFTAYVTRTSTTETGVLWLAAY